MSKRKHTPNSDFDSLWLAHRLLQRPKTPAYDKDGLEIRIEVVPAGTPHCVISMRNAIFSGQRPTNLAFDADLEIRTLRYEGGVWMTDTPQEVWQMREALDAVAELAEPELLVGGLGLGVFSHLAAEYAGAIVTTVERDPRIIEAVAPWSTRQVVQDDIYAFADNVGKDEYDIAFLDTWQSTGEHCWITEVVPLRRKLASKVKKIWCWLEEEMIGQIRMTGFQVMSVPLDRLPRTSIHYRVLRYAVEQAGLVDPDAKIENTNDYFVSVMPVTEKLTNSKVAHGILDRFLKDAGSPSWEAEFGAIWDQFAAEVKNG